MHIPDQRIRDALLNLIVFRATPNSPRWSSSGSCSQNAPSDYDLFASDAGHERRRCGTAGRCRTCSCAHFGDEGKREAAEAARAPRRRGRAAARLLQRDRGQLARLLHLHPVHRPGRQVPAQDAVDVGLRIRWPARWGRCSRRSRSTWAPGNNGLLRIVKAGRMPPEVIQRFFNKWIPTAFDLFGTDNSSSRALGVRRGGSRAGSTSGRIQQSPDPSQLNEDARELYRQEIARADRAAQHCTSRSTRAGSRCRTSSSTGGSGSTKGQTFNVDGEPMSARGLPGVSRVGDADGGRSRALARDLQGQRLDRAEEE